MAFRIPVFNITCNIWTSHAPPFPPPGAPRIPGLPCQLYYVKEQPTGNNPGGQVIDMLIRVAKGTDIRGGLSATGEDVVECPVGSGTWYEIIFVNDVARGFANEYRVGLLQQLQVATPQG